MCPPFFLPMTLVVDNREFWGVDVVCIPRFYPGYLPYLSVVVKYFVEHRSEKQLMILMCLLTNRFVSVVTVYMTNECWHEYFRE